MSNNRAEVLRQFGEFTGADETRSRFFLESSNWQLEVALSSFYEHGGNIDEPPSVTRPTPMALSSDSEDDDLESDSPAKPSKKEKKQSTNANRKFATLDSLKQKSSSEDEEGEAFYAGGSERSGQQILGPGKNRNDIVSQMFKSVRERGAVVFEDEPSTAEKGKGAFSGVGYRLGQTSDDHEKVVPAQSQSQDSARAVRLRLYREGFTVDAGPLRPYTDPGNAEFLNAIRRGEVPEELSSGGREVRVSLEDRRQDACPDHACKPATAAFSGRGHMLGSPAPPVAGEAAAPALSSADREANRQLAQAQLKVDDKAPTTTLQIRLADGGRLTGRFNHTHTVRDVSAYVAAAEPQYAARQFALHTAFPSRELSDPEVTLAEANLLNCTLMQRLK